MNLETGSLLNGYQIQEYLGKGNFGKVWKALKNGKEYAIKIIPKGKFPEVLFQREVCILKRLVTANGCRDYVLCYEDSWSSVFDHFLVTEYAKGISGHKLVESLLMGNLDLTANDLVSLLLQFTEAVEYLHYKGISHRDLKPGNIQYDPESHKLVLIDMGLSCLIDPDLSCSQTDRCKNKIDGTRPFIAPEVYRRETKNYLAVDIFALGVSFFYLLTGRYLFPGKTKKIVQNNIVDNFHLSVRTGNAELNQLILEMVNLDPALRPTAGDVADTLENISSDLYLKITSEE